MLGCGGNILKMTRAGSSVKSWLSAQVRGQAAASESRGKQGALVLGRLLGASAPREAPWLPGAASQLGTGCRLILSMVIVSSTFTVWTPTPASLCILSPLQEHCCPDGSQTERRGPSDLVLPGRGAAQSGPIRLLGFVAAFSALTDQ